MSDEQTNSGPNPSANGQKNETTTPPEETLKAELDKARNDYLYLRAEFDNYRKQAIKERSDLIKYGSEKVLLEILNVMDNVERALETAKGPEQYEALRKGFDMIAQEFRNVLGRFGVQEIPSLGLPFDPATHEALSSAESDSVDPGHVIAVHKKPYKLHDKVLRHGQVVVSKEKS